MFGLISSQIKTAILVFLALKGGAPGRQLARHLKKSPSQVFKGLHHLEKHGIIRKLGPPFFYAVNPEYPCFDELIGMIQKEYGLHPARYRFLPTVKAERKIDPESVYEIVALRGPTNPTEKLSDILRRKYA